MKFETRYSTIPILYRWPIIAASVVLVTLAAAGMKDLYFSNSYKLFFSPDNPDLVEFEDLELTYSKNDNIMVLVEPAGGDVFTPENLALIKKLTESAWQVPYSSRVDSVTNFQHTVAVGDDLSVGDLVPEIDALTSANLVRVRAVALSEPTLVNRLVSATGHVGGINITLQIPEEGVDTAELEAVTYVRQLVSALERGSPGTNFYLTGIIVMSSAFSEATLGDIQSLIPLSFVLMFLVLALMVGRITGTLVTAVLTFGSILGAVGIWGHFGMPMSPSTAIAPIVILTVAIANCVHIIATFRHGMMTGLDKDAALVESLRVNLQPVSLASLTTVVGFASLNLSDAPPFAHFGNIVAFGVMISLVLTLGFLPAMLSMLPVRAPRRIHDSSGVMERLADIVIARYRRLFWGMAIMIVIFSAGLTQIRIDDVFVNYFDQTMKFRTDSDFAADNMGGNNIIDYSLRSGEEGGVSEPAFLRDVSDLANWFNAQPEVVNVIVLTDTLRRLNKSMHGDDVSAYVLPESRELAAQYLLMYELSLPYGLDMTNQIDIEKSATRMTVTMKNLSSQEILDVDKRARKWAQENLRYVEPIAGTGPQMMVGKLGIRNARSMMWGLAIAVVLISGVLVIAFQSIRYGLISLIPNLAPILMAFGIWGFYNGMVGLGLAGVASIGLGIVIDDTVHFMSKYLRAIRERGYSPPNAVRHAFRTVGHALWTTSLILVIGFLVISRSHFYLNYGIGLLTALVVTLALVCVFLFLPAILLVQSGKSGVAEGSGARQPA